MSLWCKREDLSSNPENLFTKLTVIILNASDPSDGDLRQENEWGLLAASYLRFDERHCLKRIRQRMVEQDP